MKAFEHERNDWIIILIILLIGFLCMIVAGQWALRFAPSWKLDANMESNLDPNSDFLTRKPAGFIEPVDPLILTQPVWIDVFLTPGISFSTGTPFPTTTGTVPIGSTIVASMTTTAAVTTSPTSTLIYFPSTPSSTPKPRSTNTNGPSATHTLTSTATSTPTNTPTPSATFTLTNTPTQTLTPTNLPPPIADLQITKNDGASTYVASGILTYKVTIINNGPSAIIGAVVTDNIPAPITAWDWACASQSGGASGCDAINNNTNFSDIVDLPNGASIVYTVTANISPSANSDLTNTATVSVPVGFTDPTPGNNVAIETDQILISNPFPSGNIGTTNDGSTSTVPPGSSVTLTFGTPINVGGHAGYDLVYYELPAGIGIMMDHVILQVSDGYNWYTILNWGDNAADANTNLDITVIGGSETDNRDISSTLLYNSTGVAIELDGVIPNGTYPYIRIISPLGEDGDGCEVDAIVILP
jgi:hypothetical protein